MALVPGGIHLIKALCDRRENWRLMVKLVRCWNMCSVATPNESYALQMLFVDEELARVNFYKGHVGIQNLMNASKIYWNPEWPIAVEFKNSLAVHEVETDVCIGTISDRGRPVCFREEFLKLYPKKFVGQLVETVEEGSFVVLGTITEIIEDTSWWYMACTCMKAISYDSGFPYYDDCKTLLFELTPENKDELFYGLDDSFKTNDQLKFAPPFTKMANIEGDTCCVDLTIDINVAVSVLDVSLISIGQSSSTGCQSSSSAHEGGEGNKRELDNSVNASSDRLKRPKRKVLKTEKP
ncbi:hypothetical protein SESBI_08600 [Sesbania bispinosa]|nr:hypothetical protein SESBI_08600 [Sesbania bispinosa]